jgi:hypothetical protein
MKKKNKRDTLLRDQMVIKRVLMSYYENDLFKTLKKIHNLLLYNKATLKNRQEAQHDFLQARRGHTLVVQERNEQAPRSNAQRYRLGEAACLVVHVLKMMVSKKLLYWKGGRHPSHSWCSEKASKRKERSLLYNQRSRQ